MQDDLDYGVLVNGAILVGWVEGLYSVQFVVRFAFFGLNTRVSFTFFAVFSSLLSILSSSLIYSLLTRIYLSLFLLASHTAAYGIFVNSFKALAHDINATTGKAGVISILAFNNLSKKADTPVVLWIFFGRQYFVCC